MATMDDLFGGTKSAPQPKWNKVGDVHVGVISEEPSVVDEMDFASKKKKYFVKTGHGKSGWQIKIEGDFNEELDHSPIKQIKIPVTLKDGTAATFYMNGQKKEALKSAMQESGTPLVVGTTVGVKLAATEPSSFGVDKKIYAVKLVAAS